MIVFKKSCILSTALRRTEIAAHLSLSKWYSCSSRLDEIINLWKNEFEKHDIPEADTSLQLIISHVLKTNGIKDLENLRSHKFTVDQEQEDNINRCCECRLARVPVQYILKEWEFRDSVLKMAPPVFIPRPETESLIDIVIENTKILNKGLEIGCGSGAISIALLKCFKELQMTAIDQSKLACDLTVTNAKMNCVDDRLSVFQRKLEDNGEIPDFEADQVDIIVSNPPYLFTSEIPQLEPEIKLFEDLRALDGGADGLRVIKAILQFSSKILSPTKSCFLEIHHQHVPFIKSWLDQNLHLNLVISNSFKDMFGYERFVHVTKMK